MPSYFRPPTDNGLRYFSADRSLQENSQIATERCYGRPFRCQIATEESSSDDCSKSFSDGRKSADVSRGGGKGGSGTESRGDGGTDMEQSRKGEDDVAGGRGRRRRPPIG
ncbi:hypothetical protein LXL04_016908 [Taraxacum kok-saghyz]